MTKKLILPVLLALVSMTGCDTFEQDFPDIEGGALPPYVAFGTLGGASGTFANDSSTDSRVVRGAEFTLPVVLNWGFGEDVTYTLSIATDGAVQGTDFEVVVGGNVVTGNTANGVIEYQLEGADLNADTITIRTLAGTGDADTDTFTLTLTGANAPGQNVTAGRDNVPSDIVRNITVLG